jgi:hypothetical protein
MMEKKYISKELMEALNKVFPQPQNEDLRKQEFDRGVLYGQQQVIQKIKQWKETQDGR